ncbi:MAG: HAD family hydrolase [Pseudonocardiaceae bacterium]
MSRLTGCAIFDLDGTLHPGTLGLSLLRALVEDGSCDRRQAEMLFFFLRGLGADELRTSASAEIAYRLYAQATAGVPAFRVHRMAQRVWRREREAMFAYALPLLAALMARSYRTVLISGSPDEIIRVVAADLGIDFCQGAVFAAPGATYNGEVVVAPGVLGGKVKILRALLEDQQVDLAHSTAVGNSAFDIELLTVVGHPVAFEPSTPLRMVAVQHGWPIVDRHCGFSGLLAAIVGSGNTE